MSSTTDCARCGAQVSPSLLSCPSCRKLVHSERLGDLAREAEHAFEIGDLSSALTAWRSALELLPGGSKQHQAISARVGALASEVQEEPSRGGGGAKLAGATGALGMLLWKAKFVLAFAASKLKLLWLGFTKAGTVYTMILSLGVYWAAFGWEFGLGLVLSIYVHEMGHVAALRRRGIRADAPLFLPGLGAVVLLKQRPVDPREDADIGLAGPMWGLGCALVAAGVYLATGWTAWAAIARVGAWINLFNLIPLWVLDGARGLRALSKSQRWWLLAIAVGTWLATAEGLLVLLLLVLGFRTWLGQAPEEGHRPTFVSYSVLLVAHTLLSQLPVPL